MRDKDNFPSMVECEPTCHQVEVPTPDECAALNAMRDIKIRVRDIKGQLSDSSVDRDVLEGELDRLKAEWLTWEAKRDQAAKERMVILGHVK